MGPVAGVTKTFRRKRIEESGKARWVYATDTRGHRIAAGYRVTWTDHDGHQKTKSFARAVDAQRFANEVETDLARGVYIDPAAGKVTFSAYVARWEPAQVWRTSTRQQVASHLRAHILPALGPMPLARITRTDVQSFVNTLDAAGLAPATVEAIYRRLASILEAAVHDRLIPVSPAARITLPRRDRPAADEVVILDTAAMHRLIDAVPDRLRAFVLVMAMAGLRAGEAAGLALDRVDFLRREIAVNRQLVTVIGDTPRLAPVKTIASNRSVPIPDTLALELSRHVEQFGTVDLGGAPLLFSSGWGTPLRRTTLSDTFRRAARHADLPPEARGWHACRHFYSSALIHGGLSVRAVQARLGHASASETLDTYAHLWPETEDDTRKAIEVALATEVAAPLVGREGG